MKVLWLQSGGCGGCTQSLLCAEPRPLFDELHDAGIEFLWHPGLSLESGEELDATQRVFGMTLASQPLWWLIAAFAWHEAGPPPPMQMTLAMGVALFTGVIATVVFFHATGLVRNQPAALGAVEAMQAAELLFTSALGVLFLGEAIPQGWAALGALLVIAGIIALGVLVGRDAARDRRRQQVLRSDRGA